MNVQRLLVGLLIIGISGLAWNWSGHLPVHSSAVQVTPGSLQAGCYKVLSSQCKLRVEPLSVHVNTGQRLTALNLLANGKTLYDFRTDTGAPPAGDYSFSPVAADFGTACGQSYQLSLLARDTGGPGFFLVGQSSVITCPVGLYNNYLMRLQRR